jgi:hypothetical protein
VVGCHTLICHLLEYGLSDSMGDERAAISGTPAGGSGGGAAFCARGGGATPEGCVRDDAVPAVLGDSCAPPAAFGLALVASASLAGSAAAAAASHLTGSAHTQAGRQADGGRESDGTRDGKGVGARRWRARSGARARSVAAQRAPPSLVSSAPSSTGTPFISITTIARVLPAPTCVRR